MPAYKAEINVKKIRSLMDYLKVYKKYEFATMIGVSRDTLTQILLTGTAGPKAIFGLRNLYKKTYGEEVEDSYFVE